MASHRKPDRIKQACVPCRRKKARCPGQRPICSSCARLQQYCYYNDGPATRPQLDRSVEPTPGHLNHETGSTRWEEHLKIIRPTINAMLNDSDHKGLPKSTLDRLVNSLQPSWDQVVQAARVYLQYFESQPLPLFQAAHFLASLEYRSPGLIYALLAVTARFIPDFAATHDDGQASSKEFASLAHHLMINRIAGGRVELSTIQTLVLLAGADLNACDSERFLLHKSLAISFAAAAQLHAQPGARFPQHITEERIRCYWSMMLLQKFFGDAVTSTRVLSSDAVLVKEAPRLPLSVSVSNESTSAGTIPNYSTHSQQGILSVIIYLSESWSRAQFYIRSHGNLGHEPMWSLKSEYAEQMSFLMRIGANLPQNHRFRVVNVGSRTPEEVCANREFWAPWFLSRFMYHTIVCILNHPLLVMIQLQGHKKIPELCLQQTSSLVSHHTDWIFNLLNILTQKGLELTDPIVGYCTAIAGTIEFQLSFMVNGRIQEEKRQRFRQYLEYVQGLVKTWPHLNVLTKHLRAFEESILAAYLETSGSTGNIQINLSHLWNILEFLYTPIQYSTNIPGQSHSPHSVEDSDVHHLVLPPDITSIDASEQVDSFALEPATVSDRFSELPVNSAYLPLLADEAMISASDFFNQDYFGGDLLSDQVFM